MLLTVVALASQGALANGSVKGMLDGFVDTETEGTGPVKCQCGG